MKLVLANAFEKTFYLLNHEQLPLKARHLTHRFVFNFCSFL